jgi:hypothetical protein
MLTEGVPLPSELSLSFAFVGVSIAEPGVEIGWGVAVKMMMVNLPFAFK